MLIISIIALALCVIFWNLIIQFSLGVIYYGLLGLISVFVIAFLVKEIMKFIQNYRSKNV
jgi:hypothetical protein